MKESNEEHKSAYRNRTKPIRYLPNSHPKLCFSMSATILSYKKISDGMYHWKFPIETSWFDRRWRP